MKRFPRKKGDKDKNNIGWLRYAVTRIATEAKVQEWFNSLESKEKLEYLRSLYPKVIESKGESGLSVTFVLNGVRETKSIPGTVIKAIEEGDDH